MEQVSENDRSMIFKSGFLLIGLVVLSIALLHYIYYEGLAYMVKIWDTREEYGHGYIIPLITGFLIWQKSDVLSKTEFTGAWAGVLFTLL